MPRRSKDRLAHPRRFDRVNNRVGLRGSPTYQARPVVSAGHMRGAPRLFAWRPCIGCPVGRKTAGASEQTTQKEETGPLAATRATPAKLRQKAHPAGHETGWSTKEKAPKVAMASFPHLGGKEANGTPARARCPRSIAWRPA